MAGMQWLSDMFAPEPGTRLQDLIGDYPQEVRDEAMRRAMMELQASGMENDEKMRVKYFNQFVPEVMREFQQQ